MILVMIFFQMLLVPVPADVMCGNTMIISIPVDTTASRVSVVVVQLVVQQVQKKMWKVDCVTVQLVKFLD
jgi:hypothetical protein